MASQPTSALCQRAGALFLAALLSLGCARIYRPITLAPSPLAPKAGSVTASLERQPWGDNDRYEGRARQEGLHLLLLQVRNDSPLEVEAWIAASPPTRLLGAAEATALVRQRWEFYVLYPLAPALASLGASDKGFPVTDRMVFQTCALVGLGIAIPNAIVAARSNGRMRRQLQREAWTDGKLPPGEARHGLVLLREGPRRATSPLLLQVKSIEGARVLPLPVPDLPPAPPP